MTSIWEDGEAAQRKSTATFASLGRANWHVIFRSLSEGKAWQMTVAFLRLALAPHQNYHNLRYVLLGICHFCSHALILAPIPPPSRCYLTRGKKWLHTVSRVWRVWAKPLVSCVKRTICVICTTEARCLGWTSDNTRKGLCNYQASRNLLVRKLCFFTGTSWRLDWGVRLGREITIYRLRVVLSPSSRAPLDPLCPTADRAIEWEIASWIVWFWLRRNQLNRTTPEFPIYQLAKKSYRSAKASMRKFFLFIYSKNRAKAWNGLKLDFN